MLPVQNPLQLRDALLRAQADSIEGSQAGQTHGIFADALHAAQEQINAVDTKAQDAVIGLLSGDGVEVHDAMIATQKAELTFELALQVRNKAVSAYQQLMQMQF